MQKNLCLFMVPGVITMLRVFCVFWSIVFGLWGGGGWGSLGTDTNPNLHAP